MGLLKQSPDPMHFSINFTLKCFVELPFTNEKTPEFQKPGFKNQSAPTNMKMTIV